MKAFPIFLKESLTHSAHDFSSLPCTYKRIFPQMSFLHLILNFARANRLVNYFFLGLQVFEPIGNCFRMGGLGCAGILGFVYQR